MIGQKEEMAKGRNGKRTKGGKEGKQGIRKNLENREVMKVGRWEA